MDRKRCRLNHQDHTGNEGGPYTTRLLRLYVGLLAILILSCGWLYAIARVLMHG